MTMHLVKGMSTTSTKKRRGKRIDMQTLEAEWRKYNKDMRRKCMHSCQFDTLEDYVAYRQGKFKPKKKKESTTYASPKPYDRNTKEYPSLKTSDTIPGACSKRETQVYSGERQLLGIATMHKSNMVPIFADNKEEAVEIAQMRRN